MQVEELYAYAQLSDLYSVVQIQMGPKDHS